MRVPRNSYGNSWRPSFAENHPGRENDWCPKQTNRNKRGIAIPVRRPRHRTAYVRHECARRGPMFPPRHIWHTRDIAHPAPTTVATRHHHRKDYNAPPPLAWWGPQKYIRPLLLPPEHPRAWFLPAASARDKVRQCWFEFLPCPFPPYCRPARHLLYRMRRSARYLRIHRSLPTRDKTARARGTHPGHFPVCRSV